MDTAGASLQAIGLLAILRPSACNGKRELPCLALAFSLSRNTPPGRDVIQPVARKSRFPPKKRSSSKRPRKSPTPLRRKTSGSRNRHVSLDREQSPWMLTKGEEYTDQDQNYYEDHYCERVPRQLAQRAESWA